LNLRAIDRLIQNPEFPSLWNNATAENKQALTKYVNNVDVESTREWFEGEQVIGLDDLTRREMVNLARYFRVRNYSRMTKFQLLRELRRRDIDDKTIQERC
jgi:hypothetical protein